MLLALLPGSSSASPRESSYLANASTSYLANASWPIATLWGVLENEPIPYIWDVGTIAACHIVWAKSSMQLSLNPCVGARRHSGGDHFRRLTNRWVKRELVVTVVPVTVRWYFPGAFVTFVNLMRGRRARTAGNIASAVYILHNARSTWNTFNSTSEGFEELSKEACGYGLSLGAMYYGAPIDATGRALNLYVAHGESFSFSSIFSMTWRLGDVAASTVPLDASRLDMVWENVESFDQHAIIPSSAALRDSMLAHEPHVSPATSMGSCADTVELKVGACTGNCRVLVPQGDALDRCGVRGSVWAVRTSCVCGAFRRVDSAPSTRRLLDGAAMPVPHHSIDGVIYEPAHPTVDLHAGGG